MGRGNKNKNKTSFKPMDINSVVPQYQENKGLSSSIKDNVPSGNNNYPGARGGDNNSERSRSWYDKNKSYSKSAQNEKNTSNAQHQHGRRDQGAVPKHQSSLIEGLQTIEKNISKPVMKCKKCDKDFDMEKHLPRSLNCGHTFCTTCIRDLPKKKPVCWECQKELKDLPSPTEVPINYIVRDIVQCQLSEQAPAKAVKEIVAEMPSYLPNIEFDDNKPIVTVGSKNQSSISNVPSSEETKKNDRPSERSPHGSLCLASGIKPTYHCAKCFKWVCDKCGQIDHHKQKGCYLIPKQEALAQMHHAQVDTSKNAIETIETTLNEFNLYIEYLDAFTHSMQVAFESVAMERNRVDVIMKQGVKMKKDIETTVTSMPSVINLPDALAALQDVEKHCSEIQRWGTVTSSKVLDLQRVKMITKEIFLCTLQMKSMAERDGIPVGTLLAEHIIGDVRLYSRMEAEGGRIFVHALEKVDTVINGTRSFPLTSMMMSIDQTSALAFVDVGWNGCIKGRVFIRLLGDTQRGRQFISLCTGKVGPSLRQTGFHRLWWKGLPGEHIWGGDHDKMDGSGGTSVLETADKTSAVASGRSLPITPGLVAGRYEKTCVSSIFRIYTKGGQLKNGDKGAFSIKPEKVVDEAAFGKVEFGLDVLEAAIQQSNIREMKIFDCGVVIET